MAKGMPLMEHLGWTPLPTVRSMVVHPGKDEMLMASI
jgi:hypothetical protein